MEKTSFPKEIQSIFQEIIPLIREYLKPEYIVLAGSFGKGAWLYAGDSLLSDIEIVFVNKKKWSGSQKKELVQLLNKKYPHKIELKGYLLSKVENKLMSNYSFRNPGYINLNFFDVFNRPAYLFKNEGNEIEVKTSVSDIPIWEAWRLYVNRMGDLLSSSQNSNQDKEDTIYYWLKIFEATADAYCIINRIYAKDIAERIKIFNKELIANDPDLSELCKNSWSLIHSALVARKSHDLTLFNLNLDSSQLKEIVNSWMEFIEKKLAESEGFSYFDKFSFHQAYLNQNELHQKYLDFNGGLSILLSNGIKLAKHSKSLPRPFKYYKHERSWRHLILNTVALSFYEESLDSLDYEYSKRMAGELINRDYLKDLDKENFINTVVKYWQVIR